MDELMPCKHNYITITKSTTLPVPYRKCSKCGDVQPPATQAGDALVKLEHESVMASAALGAWLSAALDDPKVCDAMKADINRWFSAGHLYVEEAHRREAAAHAAGVVEERAKVVAWLRRCGVGRPTNSDDHIAAASAFKVAADAIERGQHKETGDADQV